MKELGCYQMKNSKMSAIFSNQYEYNDLCPLTNDRSLSTLIFAGKYRLMDFPLSSIVNAGINTVYTLINEEKVRSYFDHLGGGKEWGLDTINSYDYIDFYQKIMQKKAAGSEYFSDIIEFLETSYYPHTVFIGNKMLGNFDLKSILHFHKENGNRITAVFSKTNSENIAPDDQILVLNENNKVIQAQQLMDINNQNNFDLSLGLFIADTDWLIDMLKKAQICGIEIDLNRYLTDLAIKEQSIAYEYTGYLRNIFNIKGYYDANMEMLDVKYMTSLLSANSNHKIITRIRNEVGTYYSESSDVRRSILATGSRIFGKINHSILSRRIVVEQDAQVYDSILMSQAHIGKGAIIKNAILDKGVIVKPNVKIIGTPDKPVVIEKNAYIENDIMPENVYFEENTVVQDKVM